MTVYADVDTADDAFRGAGGRTVAVNVTDVDTAGLEWEPKELRLEEGAVRRKSPPNLRERELQLGREHRLTLFPGV